MLIAAIILQGLICLFSLLNGIFNTKDGFLVKLVNLSVCGFIFAVLLNFL